MVTGWSNAQRPRRVIILDDHTVVRAGVRSSSDGRTRPRRRRRVAQHRRVVSSRCLRSRGGRPHLPDASANRSGPPSAAMRPGHILILSMVGRRQRRRPRLRAGAVGYLTRRAALELVDAVRSVARPAATAAGTGGAVATAGMPAGPLDGVAGRELTVLRLLALGHPREVARLLGREPAHVESAGRGCSGSSAQTERNCSATPPNRT